MRKTILTGLVAFALIATIGTAMAGPSEISIGTYTQRGQVEGNFCVDPEYLSAHEFAYCSNIDTGNFAEDISTFTYAAVPADPTGEDDMPDTIFFQHIEMDEVGKQCGAMFSNSLWIADIASDPGQEDDASYSLGIHVSDSGDPVECDPPGATQSKDLDITTSWVSNGADYLLMTQDIFVENKGHCFMGGNNDDDFWPDAVGDLSMCATYGEDYSFCIESMWGKGLEYEFDWLIGEISE